MTQQTKPGVSTPVGAGGLSPSLTPAPQLLNPKSGSIEIAMYVNKYPYLRGKSRQMAFQQLLEKREPWRLCAAWKYLQDAIGKAPRDWTDTPPRSSL